MSSAVHAPGVAPTSVSNVTCGRLVNHDESGTSSRLLTLRASPETSTDRVRDSGANHRLSTWSHTNGDTYSRGAQSQWRASLDLGSIRHGTDTGCRSVSTANGARSGNGGCGDAHAIQPAIQRARVRITGPVSIRWRSAPR